MSIEEDFQSTISMTRYRKHQISTQNGRKRAFCVWATMTEHIVQRKEIVAEDFLVGTFWRFHLVIENMCVLDNKYTSEKAFTVDTNSREEGRTENDFEVELRVEHRKVYFLLIFYSLFL